ncbi:translation initiation factor IF-2-like isoform X2 [Motacilla alba alba]|uniref:translation initiation factor IF-2-like isoform X1 n=1 Tax=Motacilla alba alba TaxID=1094192 RepID=UPI0018D50233|nr:translation initiation factor IF-2-like isoform X1 [Motacilla alba alba]XP_038016652.1 translation initiation factor IF-2-like isoform X2 [Motacilla alba alba]
MQLLGSATAAAWHGRAGRSPWAGGGDGAGAGWGPRQPNRGDSRRGRAGSVRSEPVPCAPSRFRARRASVLRPAQAGGQRRGQRHQGPARAFSPERDPSSRTEILHPGAGSFIPQGDPSSRRGILHPEPISASSCLPASPQPRLCPQVTLGVPKDAAGSAGSLRCPRAAGSVTEQSRAPLAAGERCRPIPSPGPVPLCPEPPRGAGAAVAPSPSTLRRGLQGHAGAARASHSPSSVPRAGVPSRGPRGPGGEGALPQNLLPSERAGGAGGSFLHKHPQTWQDPPGIPDSEGSPRPGEVPRTCWVPQYHCVPPVCWFTAHPGP